MDAIWVGIDKCHTFMPVGLRDFDPNRKVFELVAAGDAVDEALCLAGGDTEGLGDLLIGVGLGKEIDGLELAGGDGEGFGGLSHLRISVMPSCSQRRAVSWDTDFGSPFSG